MKRKITLHLKKFYLITFIIGILISISGIFLNISVTSSLVKSTFGIDLNGFYMNLLNILQVNLITFGIVVSILSSLFYRYILNKYGKFIVFEIDYDLKKIIVSYLLVFGFIILCFSIFIQTVYVENVFYTMNGLSDDQKRILLFGDSYINVKNYAYLIPETDNVVVIGNSTTYFTNYYLYPRKLYVLPDLSGSLTSIDNDWIKERNIKWVIFHDNGSVMKISDISDINE